MRVASMRFAQTFLGVEATPDEWRREDAPGKRADGRH
jgi:hypothetical protein